MSLCDKFGYNIVWSEGQITRVLLCSVCWLDKFASDVLQVLVTSRVSGDPFPRRQAYVGLLRLVVVTLYVN